jgi:thioredoxin reductase (NADPH)
MFDVIVVGGCPGSMFCAYISKMIGLKVLLIEESGHFGGHYAKYFDKNMTDVPGFVSISGKQAVDNLKAQLDQIQTEYKLNTKLIHYKKVDHGFEVCTSAGIFTAKNLVHSGQGDGIYEIDHQGIAIETASGASIAHRIYLEIFEKSPPYSTSIFNNTQNKV